MPSLRTNSPGDRRYASDVVTVLFVCTANIARSPYAERRARSLLVATGGLTAATPEIASAGVPGVPGRPMDELLGAELRARGGEPQGHISRSVTVDLLDGADLVLTFEFAQHMRLIDLAPHRAAHIFGIRQFAAAAGGFAATGAMDERVRAIAARVGPDSMSADVPDPHRRGRRAARACADDVDALLVAILPALAG